MIPIMYVKIKVYSIAGYRPVLIGSGGIRNLEIEPRLHIYFTTPILCCTFVSVKSVKRRDP